MISSRLGKHWQIAYRNDNAVFYNYTDRAMTLSAANIIQLIFAFQAGFFGAIAIQNRRLNSFALLLFAFCLHMTFNLLAETGNLGPLPNITSAFGFAYGPLIYLFVRDISQAVPTKQKWDALHAAPFFIAIPFSPSDLLFDLIGFASIVSYLSATYLYIRRYHSAVAETLPDETAATLNWLSKGFWAFVLVASYDGARIFLSYRYSVFGQVEYYLITLGGAFLTINWLIVRAFRFRDLFSGLTESELALASSTAEPESAQLSDQESARADRALKMLEDKELFLNPQFRLAHFAEAAGEEARELSKLVQARTGERFPHIVNRLRVKHAQSLIADAREGELNFLLISYQAGFNSKSSFNQLFKQLTGMTPSKFRISVKNTD